MLSELLTADYRPRKRNARLAGLFYLLSSATFGFNVLYVLPTLIVPGDASATAQNILGSELLFRVGIVSELITAVLLILLAVTLYRLLNGVGKTLALLLLGFILVAATILFLNTLTEIGALTLLHGTDYLAVFSKPQLEAQAMLLLDLHSQVVNVDNILFGLWLIPFGVLVYRSGFFPRILGIFLILACFGYVLQSLVPLLLLPFGDVITLVSAVLGFLGEGIMQVWLIVMGANMPR